jgi:hypothetical protein
MAALSRELKCSRTDVYAPLSNQIDGLEAYLNLLRLDMSSRSAGPLNVIYNFETASINLTPLIVAPHQKISEFKYHDTF